MNRGKFTKGNLISEWANLDLVLLGEREPGFEKSKKLMVELSSLVLLRVREARGR